jgi:hypothetical protein
MDHRPERRRPPLDGGLPARPQFGWMRHGPVGRPANDNRRPLLARLVLIVLPLLALAALYVGVSATD